MSIKWTESDAYILGEIILDKKFKKVVDSTKIKNKKGKITIINPILEGGIEKGKVTIDCNVEKRNGEILVNTCTIMIPRLTVEDAETECIDEIESSFPIEWLDKYGETEKNKAIKACIEYKRITQPERMKEYYEINLENEIEGWD